MAQNYGSDQYWNGYNRGGGAYVSEAMTAPGEYLRRIRKGENTLGLAQLQQGLGEAQRGLMAQGAASGANPAAEAAALNGAANMMATTNADAAKLRAQEEQGAIGLSLQGVQVGQQNELAKQQLELAKKKYDDEQAQQGLQNTMSGIGAAGAALGSMAMMFSDERRKVAIQALEAGDKDAALSALSKPREQIVAEQSEMDRYIDSRLRREGLDPLKMSDADHERAAVRIMGTPGGRAWAPGKRVPPDLERALGGDVSGDDAATARALEMLGGRTDAELHAATPKAQADDTQRNLGLYTYQYDPVARAAGAPPGTRVGPVAQELERTPLGASVVSDTPVGKVVDRDQALGLALGLLGRTGERLDRLEGKGGAGAMVSDAARKDAVRAVGQKQVDEVLRRLAGESHAEFRAGPNGEGRFAIQTPFGARNLSGPSGSIDPNQAYEAALPNATFAPEHGSVDFAPQPVAPAYDPNRSLFSAGDDAAYQRQARDAALAALQADADKQEQLRLWRERAKPNWPPPIQ